MKEQTYILASTSVAMNASTMLRSLPCDGTMEVVFRLKTKGRNSDQNALLHATLTDISEQVVWYGKKLSVDVWKRLCMASWLRERKEQPILIPALDGIGYDVIFEKTSKLTVSQCAELIEWCFAFGGEQNVKFRISLKEIP